MVAHVHGAHTTKDSDGYPEAWFSRTPSTSPPGTTGTFYGYVSTRYNQSWAHGKAAYKYPNDQRATTLWHHDHTLGRPASTSTPAQRAST